MDLAEAFKFMIGPFRSSIVCRRLLRFQQPGDVVYAKTMDFFIKLLKSSRSHDFLKQIELDDTVDSMKNFQELHSAEHDK